MYAKVTASQRCELFLGQGQTAYRWDKLHACTDHSVFRPLVFRPNSPGALEVFSCSQATITRIPTFHNAPFSGRGRANAINSHYRPTLDAGANHNWLRRHTGVWVCVCVCLCIQLAPHSPALPIKLLPRDYFIEYRIIDSSNVGKTIRYEMLF